MLILFSGILNDHEEFSPKAKEIIDKHVIEVPVEVLCEVIYVLTGHYKIDRQNISTELKRFFEQTQCTLPHQEAILQVLEYFWEILLTLWIAFWQVTRKLRRTKYIHLMKDCKN